MRIASLRALVDFRDGRLTVEDVSTGGAETIEDVDTVVAVKPNRACNPLEAEMEAAGLPYVMAGDCLAPRTALEAVFEGHAAGRRAGAIP